MRVLWICNVVINDFVGEFGIKKCHTVGWLESMLHRLEKEQDLTIGVCCPIIDEERMKNGVLGGHPYYSFHLNMNRREYDSDMKKEFIPILQDFKPDVIEIWGTEYNHSLAMTEACEQLGIINKVLIEIQGIVSYYAIHYDLGVPHKYLDIAGEKIASIADGQKSFMERGKNEFCAFRKVKHISDCTHWGKICADLINPSAKFHYSGRILRDVFYRTDRKHDISACRKYSIFVSQANYPIKGFHFLLKAMGLVQTRYPQAELYVAGREVIGRDKQNGYSRYLQDITDEENLADKVHFLGILSDEEMAEQYLRAHIFVSASTIEDPSNSVCEAMILGTPTVASYVGGTTELITHEKDGLLYPANEYYILAGQIMRIFDDDEFAARLSENAKKTAHERHNKQKIGERQMGIYRAIISEEKFTVSV